MRNSIWTTVRSDRGAVVSDLQARTEPVRACLLLCAMLLARIGGVTVIPKEPRKQINLRLDSATMHVLRAASESSGISMTNLIRAAILAHYGDGQASRVAQTLGRAVEASR